MENNAQYQENEKDTGKIYQEFQRLVHTSPFLKLFFFGKKYTYLPIFFYLNLKLL